MFVKLLRQLGVKDLIQQTHDGVLILGLKGERLVNHYSFYTAFNTPEEYRIVTRGKTLGTLPIIFPLFEGMFMIFAGRRWKVLSVDVERKVVDVVRAAAGKVPRFSGGGGFIHDKILQEMSRIYRSDDIPAFLDRTALDLLKEGRENFFRLALDSRYLVRDGKHTLLFCWMGSQVANTICLLLRTRGLAVEPDGIAIMVRDISPERLLEQLKAVVDMGPVDAVNLATIVEDKVAEKHDCFLDEELLNWNYTSNYLAPQIAWETLQSIVH